MKIQSTNFIDKWNNEFSRQAFDFFVVVEKLAQQPQVRVYSRRAR